MATKFNFSPTIPSATSNTVMAWAESTSQKPSTLTYPLSPLVLTIALSEQTESHEAIGQLDSLAVWSDRTTVPDYTAEHCVRLLNKVSNKHQELADQILEYYSIKYAQRKMAGGELTGFQREVLKLRNQFSDQNYCITESQRKILWRLPDFYRADQTCVLIEQQLVSTTAASAEADFELKFHTEYTVYSQRGNTRVMVFSTPEQHAATVAIDQRNTLMPLIEFLIGAGATKTIRVRARSTVNPITPDSDFLLNKLEILQVLGVS
jgi:hypothetical protein